ncbi:MAG: tetratricopeptide repeat protein [Alphaproteobacteria bacterium]|nr:tetratricopeptide repeat protein [Alphaproteobacteria bacterium]
MTVPAQGALPPDRDKRLAAAVSAWQAGDPRSARAALVPLLGGLLPDPDAASIDAVCSFALGDHEGALAAMDALAAAYPGSAAIAFNRAKMLRDVGRLADAIGGYRRATALAPSDGQAWFNLASAQLAAGEASSAIESAARAAALGIKPALVAPVLAQAHSIAGDRDSARQVLRSAAAASPPDRNAARLLARDLAAYGPADERLRTVEALARAHPEDALLRAHLASALAALGRHEDALAAARASIDAAEGRAEALPWILGLLRDSCAADRMLDPAQAIDLIGAAPAESLSMVLLGVLTYAERPEDIAWLKRLHLRLATSARQQAGADPAVARRQAAPAIAESSGRPGGRPGARPLRIGLLSSDLRGHAVGRFAASLVAHHDRDCLALHLYSSYLGSDDFIAAGFARDAAVHRRIGAMAPADAAALIRSDQIDVLVEMNGHTRDSAVQVAAWRPAPVQVSWLGYPFSTGLSEIDYFLCDSHLQPGSADLLMERPLLVEPSWIAFAPARDRPPRARAAGTDGGSVVFGTLNAPYKYTRSTLAMWAEVLRAVPMSRFRIVRPEAARSALRANVTASFAAEGIDPTRIEFLDNHGAGIPHWQAYDGIDVSLDTWPLTGGTTTIDSIERGVPVVTRVGPAVHQRISHAILAHAGAGALSARTPDEFVRIAVALATDPDRLAAMSAELPHALWRSPLCDRQGFARSFARCMAEVATRHALW